MKKLFFISLMAFLISACLPQGVRVPQDELQPLLERKSGLIAYIGLDGNLYVADQGGVNTTQITTDALIGQSNSEPYLYYRAPTWSKDGAYVGFVREKFDGEQNTQNIMIADVAKGSAQDVFSNPAEIPIYLYWSPDNQNLSFISSAASGQNIILQSVPAAGGGRTVIDIGTPYYWSWAPDGKTLITHNGGGSDASAPDHISFIQLQDPGGEIIEDGLDAPPASFQAPAWSPDGSRIALTRLNDGKNEIILTDSAGVYEKTLGTFDINAAFAWSFDGARLAYIDGAQRMNAGILGDMRIVNIETGEETTAGKDVVAFFWSPNSEKIAYFEYVPVNSEDASAPQYVVALKVLDVASGDSRELFTYLPSQQFLSILPYFDQYHQSFTLWSPDNNNLVLSFVDSQGNPGIAIASATGNLEPRMLAEGYLGVWSWK